MIKVVKFGGSSLADADQFRKVADIIKSDPDRRYVVASAPGKRDSHDEKVTDLLLQCFRLACDKRDINETFDRIAARYNGIIADLGLDFSLDEELEGIRVAIRHHASRDYIASRGEYLNSKILANFLGFPFIDAEDCIFFDENGALDVKKTDKKMSAVLSLHEYAVIPYAKAFKAAGVKALVEVVGGFHDPYDMEKYLSEGVCDLISMGRSYICDPEYGKKLEAGNVEDISPCVRCNKCHMQNETGPWLNVCSVNPIHGLEPHLAHMIEPSGKKKRVAVIGGGPAGMAAAIFAAKSGHSVDLFERSDRLGGQLNHADYASFKWPLKDFKDWMIRQLERKGVALHLNTCPDPEDLQKGQYDAVFAALGAGPTVLPIPGSNGPDIRYAMEVYGREQQLGQNVIIVGGAETGTETALYLCECGHHVTVVSRQNDIAPDCDRIQYREVFVDACRAAEDAGKLHFILEANTTAVTGTSVTYTDRDGISRTIEADSVIMSSGSTARQREALAYAGCAPTFRLLGDCNHVSNMQAAIRSGFAAAKLL